MFHFFISFLICNHFCILFYNCSVIIQVFQLKFLQNHLAVISYALFGEQDK